MKEEEKKKMKKKSLRSRSRDSQLRNLVRRFLGSSSRDSNGGINLYNSHRSGRLFCHLKYLRVFRCHDLLSDAKTDLIAVGWSLRFR